MEHFLEGSASIKLWKLRREKLCLLLFSFGLRKEFLNGMICFYFYKYSIKAKPPASK